MPLGDEVVGDADARSCSGDFCGGMITLVCQLIRRSRDGFAAGVDVTMLSGEFVDVVCTGIVDVIACVDCGTL